MVWYTRPHVPIPTKTTSPHVQVPTDRNKQERSRECQFADAFLASRKKHPSAHAAWSILVMFFLLGPGCVVQPWGHGVWRGFVAFFLGPGCFVQPCSHGVGGAFFFLGSGCFTQGKNMSMIYDMVYTSTCSGSNRLKQTRALQRMSVRGCFSGISKKASVGPCRLECLGDVFSSRSRLRRAALGPWRLGAVWLFFWAPAALCSLGAMALEGLFFFRQWLLHTLFFFFFGPGCFTQPWGHGAGGAWCFFRSLLLHAASGPWRWRSLESFVSAPTASCSLGAMAFWRSV